MQGLVVLGSSGVALVLPKPTSPPAMGSFSFSDHLTIMCITALTTSCCGKVPSTDRLSPLTVELGSKIPKEVLWTDWGQKNQSCYFLRLLEYIVVEK